MSTIPLIRNYLGKSAISIATSNLNIVGTTSNLHTRLVVQGNAIVTGNLTVQGSNIVNNQIVNNIEYNSSNVIINNLSGLGPALKVSQSGVGANYPIADFYDNDVSTTIPALRIADGGNVGIGTTNPLAKLHLYDTGTTDILRIDDAVNDNTSLLVDNEGRLSISTTLVLIGSYSVFHHRSDGSYEFLVQRSRLDSETYITNAQTALYIRIPEFSSAIYKISSALVYSGNTGYYQALLRSVIDNAKPTLSLNTTYTVYLYSGKLDNESFVYNGNVGIGITNPTQKLDVAGDISISTASVPLAFNSGLGGTAPIFNMAANYNISNLNAAYKGGAFRIDLRSDLSSYPLFQWLFRPANGANSAIMSLYENGNLNVEGNLGIGITNPPVALTVSRDATLASGLYAGDNAQGQLYITGVTNTNKRLALLYDTTANKAYIQSMIQGSGHTPLVLNAAGGNVGIGTTNPQATLDVNGTVKSLNLSINDVTNAFMPRGGIIMWYGSIVSIPTGWAICNGTNGTPDLRNRFIIGAGSTYAVAATGGSTTKTLTEANMPSHNHTGNTDYGGSHRHYQNVGANPGNGGPVWRTDFTGDAGGAWQYSSGVLTDYDGNHYHTFATSYKGSGTAFDIMPPYYALAYIMKL